MSQNLLFNTLGILIGFVGVMLILSLLVTALTQFVVGMLSIRARNLRFGLDRFLEQAMKVEPDAQRPKTSKPTAATLLNESTTEGDQTRDGLEALAETPLHV